jgi:hypothetical protein
LEITIVKDSWKAANTLREKMDLAILASNVLDKLNILQSNTTAPCPNIPASPLPSGNTPTPMDIDVVSANLGFSFLAYCGLCVKKKLFQRCLKHYDNMHATHCSCPNTEVQMKEKLDFFLKHSKQGSAPASGINHVGLASMGASTLSHLWDDMEFTSFTDLMMHGCNVDGNPIIHGESSLSVYALSPSTPVPLSTSSCIVLPITFSCPGSSFLLALALLDSREAGSFIDKGFVTANQLPLTKLPVPFSCRIFNGSPATSGDVTHFWSGSVLISVSSHVPLAFQAVFFVTSLSSFDVILGLPWLHKHHMWVGGPLSQLLFSSSFGDRTSSPFSPCLASISTNTLSSEELILLPSSLCLFSDVFTVVSLQTLPPIRPQFDLKIQLKPNCVPPFRM